MKFFVQQGCCPWTWLGTVEGPWVRVLCCVCMNEDLSSSKQHPHKTPSMEAWVPVTPLLLGGKTDIRITGVVWLAASLQKSWTDMMTAGCETDYQAQEKMPEIKARGKGQSGPVNRNLRRQTCQTGYWEAKAGRCQVQGQSGLYSEFQDSQDCREKSCLNRQTDTYNLNRTLIKMT